MGTVINVPALLPIVAALPRFINGATHRQRVWMSAAMRHDLRRLGGMRDCSCSDLLREAIVDVMAKFAGGSIPQPPAKPSFLKEEWFNQTARIDLADRETLRRIAFDNRCDCSDLVREGIDDLLRKYAPIDNGAVA